MYSLSMNLKFSILKLAKPHAVVNFLLIVSELVQVNPGNSLSVLTSHYSP